MIRQRLLACLAAATAIAAAQSAAAQDCTINIGAVLSITGPNAAIGSAIGDAGRLAVDHFNEAGGAAGCKLNFVLRDDQGQPNVGVDAAKTLVSIDRSPVILGAIASGVSLPILTSVSVPSKVTQISCCSSAPTFTELAEEGGTQGYFFRTLPTDRPQAVVMAKIAKEKGYGSVAIIYVNSDYGNAMAKNFTAAAEAQGIEVTDVVGYNQEQASYRAEVSAALKGKPDALFLVAFPADGATITREWLAFGGSKQLLLSNAMRAREYVEAVGAQHLTEAVGIDNAQTEGPSVEAFNAAWTAEKGSPPEGPGLHTMYDATAVALLALEKAGAPDGTAIRDAVREVTGGQGTTIYPGPEGFAKAKELIAAGEPITYEGATGPIKFDENGDVTGPYLIWGVADGELTTLDQWDMARVDAALAEVSGQ
ncbi:ABC transporter substrate-binding protein [Paracoccus sp. S-4012]|uniref:ABC transporter substrate-binding protein n=1 Tax=Paracoccus sp. S-4012 TaxID=2665648 RepID=UPI0012B0F066|nr:ABC transporter substrate-binding protein [Paracoccus sp. S-4012]MRX51464.1 ABC transporter substrate-binding protein [Paracoccus sp. S-4012]